MITQLTLDKYEPFLAYKHNSGQVIWRKADHRIKLIDDSWNILDYLNSDYFNYQYTHEANPETSSAALIELKREHIDRITDTGLYGVVLEKWNPEVDKGWEQVDSIWSIEFTDIPQIIDEYFTRAYRLHDL